jgi:hypothetical protein
MTHRERLLAALQCQPVDEMPFVHIVDGFNYPVGVPQDLLSPFDMVALGRYLGGAALDRTAPSPISRRDREVTTESQRLPSGDTEYTYTTPVGTLRATYTPSSEAHTWFLVGHCVRGVKDYEALQCLIADPALEPSPEGIEAARKRLEEVGEDGFTYTVGPATPIMDLARSWVGLEQLVMDLVDETAVVERTLDVMAEKAYEEFELLAAHTPARLLVFWDDVTSLYFSPDIVRRYVLPVYSTYADICHSHGKLLVAHACGHLNALLPVLAESGMDAMDWVTPPPTGDVIWSEAQELFAGRVAVMGAPAPGIMRFGSADDVEAHLREALRGVDGRRGFVLMVPSPSGTPMENARRAEDVARAVDGGS